MESDSVAILIRADHHEKSLVPLEQALQKFLGRFPDLGFQGVQVTVEESLEELLDTVESIEEMAVRYSARLDDATPEVQKAVLELLLSNDAPELEAPATEEQLAYSFHHAGLFPRVSPTFGEERDPETGEIIDAGYRTVHAGPGQVREFPVVKTTEPECPVAPGMGQIEGALEGQYRLYLYAGRSIGPIVPSEEGVVFTEGQMASWPEHLRFPPLEGVTEGHGEE